MLYIFSFCIINKQLYSVTNIRHCVLVDQILVLAVEERESIILWQKKNVWKSLKNAYSSKLFFAKS